MQLAPAPADPVRSPVELDVAGEREVGEVGGLVRRSSAARGEQFGHEKGLTM
jgi:hypothetical protein